MLDHLLEPSHPDDFNKLSNIGFGEEIMQQVSIEVNLRIKSGALPMCLRQFVEKSLNTTIRQIRLFFSCDNLPKSQLRQLTENYFFKQLLVKSEIQIV